MKKTSWTIIKQIVGDNNNQADLFLTLINEDGLITCANASMIKDLGINDPRQAATNFFDLVHPFNPDEFKKKIHCVKQLKAQRKAGLSYTLKTGYITR